MIEHGGVNGHLLLGVVLKIGLLEILVGSIIADEWTDFEVKPINLYFCLGNFDFLVYFVGILLKINLKREI